MNALKKHILTPLFTPSVTVLSFTAVLLFSGLSVGYAISINGESPTAEYQLKIQPVIKQLKRDYSKVAIPLKILLDDVTTVEKASLQAQSKDQPLKIGFGRKIPQAYQEDLYPSLSWESLANGDHVAAFSVTSPNASAVRIALQMDTLPENAEVRFFSAKNTEIFGPVTKSAQNTSPINKSNNTLPTPIWSPVIEGDTARVEIYLPNTVKNKFQVKISGIQHLLYSPQTKQLSDIGSSGACNIDIKCANTTPSNLSAAVAKIVYSDANWSYLCSGTLLKDSDPSTWIPYFMTANHCIATQALASTIDSYWFFERAVCGGANPTTVTHFTGGADLLATNTTSDFAFLKLRDTQISSLPGIFFAGWSTDNITGLAAIGIHHPSGDLKKWSQGTADGYAPVDGPVDGLGNFIHVTWSQGVTEQGSSGSGLFAFTSGTSGQQLFVGDLHGGGSSCSTPTNPDWYGSFDMVYPLVSQWLNAPPALYTVTPSIGHGGNASPSVAQAVNAGATQSFNVVPNIGWINIKGVTGTCPKGSWSGNIWTTGAIYANCTVQFKFFCLACLPSTGGWRSLLK